MGSKEKPAPETPNKPVVSSLGEMLGELVRQGTEGFIATQKILLDLAAQQNALALTIIRERVGLFSSTPTKAVVELAGRGMKNFIEAQQVLLDMAVRQNEIVANGVKPALTDTPIEALAEVVHQGIENFINAQKHFLQIFESEAEGAIKDFARDKTFDTGRLADLARDGTKNFLRSQKKFLDIVEKQLTVKKPKEAGDEVPPKEQHVDIFEMAKESTDAFVEAQERLLDLASDQIDLNVRMARQLFSLDTEAKPPTTLPDLVKKSVDSFVAAQKALVDLASKPRVAAEQEVAVGKAS